jgi:E3 ubiquitin-protein ligase TRIP12
MDRGIVVGNKACANRVRERHYKMHMDRLKGMRPQVDTSEPHVKSLYHLQNNLKREQLEEEKYQNIDRENKILLQKMSDIMQHKTYSAIRAASGPPSMNRDARKVELMRITRENQNILQRIQKAQPVLNHVEWANQHRQNQVRMKNACEYPPALRTTKTRFPALQNNMSASSINAGEAARQTKGGSSAPDISRGSGEQDPAELKYVLKEGRHLGKQYYLVEMATDGKMLAISAYDGEQQRTLELLVNEKNHRRLYRDANGDYNIIASKLRVDGEQLVIDSEGSAGGAPYEGGNPTGAGAPAS